MESSIDYSHQDQTTTVGITTTSIALFVIVIRLICRKWVSHFIGIDDWLMAMAVGIMIVFCALHVSARRYGDGLHIFDIAPSNTRVLLKIQFVIEVIYYFCVYLIKLSILAFYLRLIAPATKTRRMTWITIWLISLYVVVHVFVTFLQCIPLTSLWDFSVPGRCINLPAYYYSSSVFNVITDVVIVALPMKQVASMSRSTTDKVLVIGLFAFSFVACIISCIRVYTIKILLNSHDPSWDVGPLVVWSYLETFAGIICGSAPALKPLLTKIKVFRFKPKGVKDTESSADTLTPSSIGESFGLKSNTTDGLDQTRRGNS